MKNWSLLFQYFVVNGIISGVLYGERGLRAIEVKHSDRIRREDFKGLKQFKGEEHHPNG